MTVATSFLYENSTVCPSTNSGECNENMNLAKKYEQLTNTMSSQRSKLSDMQTLYGRELAFTFNMIVGCVGLGLYIKYNQ